METTKVNFSVTLDDASKLPLLLELLRHLDFLRVDEVEPATSPPGPTSSFHSLSGIWAETPPSYAARLGEAAGYDIAGYQRRY